MKVLVAFESKGNTTRDYALAIAGVLRKNGIETDVINVAKMMPDISKYGTVIVGMGMRMGRLYKNALKFLELDMKDKKVALFFSTLQTKKDVMNRYVGKIMKANPKLSVFSVGIFGGRFKILFKKVDDRFDAKSAEIWAHEMLDKLV